MSYTYHMKILYLTSPEGINYYVEHMVSTKIANMIKWLVGIPTKDIPHNMNEYTVTFSVNDDEEEIKRAVDTRSSYIKHFYSLNDPTLKRTGSSGNLFRFLKAIDLMPPVFINDEYVQMFMNDPSSGMYRLMETYYSISSSDQILIFHQFFLNKFHPHVRNHIITFFANLNEEATVIFEADD